MVASDLDRGRRDEIGERTRPEGEAPLVGRKLLPWFGGAAAKGDERHQVLLSVWRLAWTTSAVQSASSLRIRWTRASSGHQQA